MCGFAGAFQPARPIDEAAGTRLARAMAAPILHRGPDDEGVVVVPEAGFLAGFRRLAIVDLSPAGHQPMTSRDGRLTILFNGEIYNREALAAALPDRGAVLRGHSDTEAMLEHIACFGLEATLAELIGMFAIALFDHRERRLTLVRDRLGIKPLYWSRCTGRPGGPALLFASQPKCLHGHPAFEPSIDEAAMAQYLRYGYVPAPASIYRGVHKLRPGHLLTMDAGGAIRERCWWTLDAIRHDAASAPDDDALLDGFAGLLDDAIARRMVADVPLGAFLSGGIDSSLTVARMQHLSDRPIATFTIGFTDRRYDESAAARAVARHLGTDHTHLTLEPTDALSLVPDLAEWFDEPFADSSMLPTLLVSRLARKDVTVSLSGDGGDELFGGYTRYDDVERLWSRTASIPPGIRRLAASVLGTLPDPWLRALDRLPTPRALRLDERRRRLVALLGGRPRLLMRDIVSHWRDPSSLMPGVVEPLPPAWAADGEERPSPGALGDTLQRCDIATYLPDDILTKVDRASMAVGLEARVPLLDHRLVEMVWRARPDQRRRAGTTKWLLGRLLDRDFPRTFFDRPKQGFSLPIDDWLRGALRPWAEELLSRDALDRLPMLDAGRVRRAWDEHRTGRADRRFELFNILMLSAWNQRWGTRVATSPARAV
ncbi:MAG: asparagine synthase (glutamine-hydrolyzing) [Geminicoccaceae bacterium]|nr:asparagine synthase (glutamine-hydrolyzing) [Geminicoccaceae bacterium]